MHRTMNTSPDPWLKALAPSRDHLVRAVEGVFPWDGLADCCAPAGMPVGLGQALALTAIQGGQAQHDQIAAQQIAV
jgi:hypothetical protein